ncbi:MAG: SDR family NAD(P)-dependent oxidoreductase [Anaerolineaceae bacterium]|nr:SDR family NAD(P)-dependent oxidoreductase [Anaerolineaceae bacterium]
MADFTDQVVIVTGGTGNLGRAIVRAFFAAGAHLVVPDRSIGQAAQLLPDVAGSKDHILKEGVDVTNPEHMQRLVEEVLARFGRIDVLVNTVGGYRAGAPLHETPLETWDFMLNLNARSVYVACRAVIPAMLSQSSGKIVNISSHSALTAQGGDAAYSASKSAVARLTESMAADYKRQGIQVNAIIPSALVSADDLKTDATRGVTPEAVAQVILFLCSESGRIINGALIPTYGLRF